MPDTKLKSGRCQQLRLQLVLLRYLDIYHTNLLGHWFQSKFFIKYKRYDQKVSGLKLERKKKVNLKFKRKRMHGRATNIMKGWCLDV